MGALRRVVVGEGWGNFVGTLLILGLGVGLVVSEAPRLRGVLQPEPRPMACDAWLSGPREVRWVSLSGCSVEGSVLRGPGAPVRVTGNVVADAPLTGLVTVDDGGFVLAQGERPARGRVLGTTLAGFLVLLFGLWPMARRVMVERALPPAPPAGGGEPPGL
jgi:hypothetical protein